METLYEQVLLVIHKQKIKWNRFPPPPFFFLSQFPGCSQAEWGHVWRWCSSRRSCEFCDSMSETAKLLQTWLMVLLNSRDFTFFCKLIFQFSLAHKRIYDRRSRKCLHSNNSSGSLMSTSQTDACIIRIFYLWKGDAIKLQIKHNVKSCTTGKTRRRWILNYKSTIIHVGNRTSVSNTLSAK